MEIRKFSIREGGINLEQIDREENCFSILMIKVLKKSTQQFWVTTKS